jgi:hypothetical protein
MLMKFDNMLRLAIVGCAVVSAQAFAQTTPTDTQPKEQAPTKQPAHGATTSGGSSHPSTNGVTKQSTQGLPPGLGANYGSSRNQQGQASKSQ